MTYDKTKLLQELTRHEGLRSYPYKDTVGVPTVGVGHNLKAHGLPLVVLLPLLERVGLNREECDNLLQWGIDTIAAPAVQELYSQWRTLTDARQRVLLNMAFNLGVRRFAGFQLFWEAVDQGDWVQAGAEMIDSKWYRQVGRRGEELVAMWLEG